MRLRSTPETAFRVEAANAAARSLPARTHLQAITFTLGLGAPALAALAVLLSKVFR